MLNENFPEFPKIDPWTASSLLQKAIRRGEADLAVNAAKTLYRQRGKAIWRRLINIAFEDVGIAEPKLLLEVTSLATDKLLREAAGPDSQLLSDMVSRLALAPKDRSTDYLYSAATRWPPCLKDRSSIRRLNIRAKVEILVGDREPLIRKAVVLLDLLTVDGAGQKVVPECQLNEIFALMGDRAEGGPLLDAALLAAKQRNHPFILMAIILQMAFCETAEKVEITRRNIGQVDFVQDIPLYAYDKHTSLGKRAITIFAQECPKVRELLHERVSESNMNSVAQMAVFYAESFIVAEQFCWSQSHQLEVIGMDADLTYAGAHPADVGPIVECVRTNLVSLNDVRRRLLLSRGRN